MKKANFTKTLISSSFLVVSICNSIFVQQLGHARPFAYNRRHLFRLPEVAMKRSRLLTLAVALAAALGAQTLVGRSEQAPTPDAAVGPFDSLHFRSIGPASMSGRISDLAVYEPNPAIFYVGTAHGGVWKTTNNGTTFEPQLQDLGLMAIGDVAVSQNNPDLVYVGTGESNNRQSTSWGDGVYKSTDGGKTYTNIGLKS